MLVVEAPDADDLRALKQDPWSEAGLLMLTSIELWQVTLAASPLSG